MKRALWMLVCVMAVMPMVAQQIVLTPIVSGLKQPVVLTHAYDSRLFIGTQAGQIFVYDGELRAEPFLDLTRLVKSGGEQGLLGLAFHPRFAENGTFFVTHVDLDGDTVLTRYRVGVDGRSADPSSRTVLLTISHQFSPMHYSGNLAFGPDGYLYMSTGDGGGDDYVGASRLDSLLGKILRLDVSGEAYTIPPTNPFVGVPDAREEVWAYGLRNPWRFSFDRETGDLWIADVGQDEREEVNLQHANSRGGEYYGWYGSEGTFCHPDSDVCEGATPVVAPVLEYAHNNGRCAVTGGYRYRGTQSPELYGFYFYGDFCTGAILTATERGNGRWRGMTTYVGPDLISSFGEDAEGELYVLDYTGTVFAIDAYTLDRSPRADRRRQGMRGSPLSSRE